LIPTWAFPCTVFSIPQSSRKIVAKSYDWYTGHGLIIVNQRGVYKEAFEGSLKWTSRYGSISLSQLGKEFPQSGMNEKGLVVEILWLDKTVFPEDDSSLPTINEVQWIQYLLDRADSTKTAIKLANRIQIKKIKADVHYMVCDRFAKCATFEYLGGKLTVHSGQDIVVPTLSNHTYEESVNELSKYRGFGGELPIPRDRDSLGRFVKASDSAKAFRLGQDEIGSAFRILDSVRLWKVTSRTQWQIVYDVMERKIYLETRHSKGRKVIQFSAFDFDCRSEALMYPDIDEESVGDVSRDFVPYSTELNAKMMHRNTFVPKEIRARGAIYPETLLCNR